MVSAWCSGALKWSQGKASLKKKTEVVLKPEKSELKKKKLAAEVAQKLATLDDTSSTTDNEIVEKKVSKTKKKAPAEPIVVAKPAKEEKKSKKRTEVPVVAPSKPKKLAKTPVVQAAPPKKTKAAPPPSSDTSETSSDASSSDDEKMPTPTKAAPTKLKPGTPAKKQPVESSTSDSSSSSSSEADSDSSEEESKGVDAKQLPVVESDDDSSSDTSSESSSSDSSSDDDEQPVVQKVVPQTKPKPETKKKAAKAPSSSSSSSDSEDTSDSDDTSESDTKEKTQVATSVKKQAPATSSSDEDTSSDTSSSDDSRDDSSESDSESHRVANVAKVSTAKVDNKASAGNPKKRKNRAQPVKPAESEDDDSDDDMDGNVSDSEKPEPCQGGKKKLSAEPQDKFVDPELANVTATKKRARIQNETAPQTEPFKKSFQLNSDGKHEIFVGNLPYGTSEKELCDLFEESCGKIIKTKILSQGGAAFIEFESAEAMRSALEWNRSEYNGRRLNINPASEKPTRPPVSTGANRARGPDAPPNCTVIVRNIPYSITQDVLKSHFAECGNVTGVNIPIHQDTQKIRGFGIVNFSSPEGAQAALELDQSQISGRTVNVEIARERDNNGPNRNRAGGPPQRKPFGKPAGRANAGPARSHRMFDDDDE